MSPDGARCPAISVDLASAPVLLRIRHRLVSMIVALPIALWSVVAFTLVRDEGWVETLIRLVLLVAVAVASVWLMAGGFDVRHLGTPTSEVLIRLAGVALVAGVALFLTGDAWVFGGELTKDVSVLKQGLVAAFWLAALGGAVLYRRTAVAPLPSMVTAPSVVAAGPAVSAPAGPAVSGPAGPAVSSPAGPTESAPAGLGLIQRWPHLISGLLIVGPLFVGEALLMLLMAACGSDDSLFFLVLLAILAVPVTLPGLGLVLDRRRRSVPEGAGDQAPGPAGFALAFGTMALVAFAHLVTVFVLMLVATAGYGPGTGTDC